MAPRLAARPARENDFSNVGKVGRRTGVTLPQGRLDLNGMEEISGIFSSPRKPSPLKHSMTIVESVEEHDNEETPRPRLSARKSLPPRSASPRKSGISGTAKRSRIMDATNRENDVVREMGSDQTPKSVLVQKSMNMPLSTRSKSSTRTPLLDRVLSSPRTVRTSGRKTTRSEQTPGQQSTIASTEPDQSESQMEEQDNATTEDITANFPGASDANDDYILPTLDDGAAFGSPGHVDHYDEPEHEPLRSQYDDEDADETFQPGVRSKPRSREPTIANSRKKRKSDAVDHVEVDALSSPAAKRAKRISGEGNRKPTSKPAAKRTDTIELQPEVESEQEPEPELVKEIQPKPRGRPREPLKSKNTNTKLPSQQEIEIENVVEKIKARPGQKKSLYILRRETPADEGVTHTRSGRVSVKPLAYWRNEKCVFGGSPGGASLQIGARFPLNSIKEIIRTDEVYTDLSNQSKKRNKGKGKAKAKSQSVERAESESELEVDDEQINIDAEPWETDIGTFRGSVQVWDTEQQTPIDEEQEVDIAYAPAAIETREVKNSTFKYAKLISTKFMGSGIVELPPGGVKKPKNSNKMHMSFFVASGRVTVRVGPINGSGNRFSIGKGGFWQVPRGNQYSIENEHEKTAKLFFNQACEAAPVNYDE